MKLNLLGALTLILLSVNPSEAQEELINRIFSDKPADYRNQLVLEDTLASEYFYHVSEYGATYSTVFTLNDFQGFVTYRNKQTNKVGLVVYGGSASCYTEAIADSIYFLRFMDYLGTEAYDADGNYAYSTEVKSVQFYFDLAQSKDECWTATGKGSSCTVERAGTVEKDLFKAVEFTETLTSDGYSIVNGVYANLSNNKIYNSSVLNQMITVNEVYAYHYDYYGEYDYYYSYEMPETDYSIPTFETRLNYEPIEIVYTLSGDTIGEVLSYTYAEADPLAYVRKVVPDNFSGVWKTNDDYQTLLIIDGDDLWSAYGVYQSNVDSYKNTYDVSSGTLESMISHANISSAKQDIEKLWKGSRTDVRMISLTSWVVMNAYRDIYLSNDEIMIHIILQMDPETKKASTVIETMEPQKIYTGYAIAKYDSYNYSTILTDANGKPIDLYSSGVDYYYNYNLAVADRNIDENGNLVLTNESLGSIQFTSFSGGANYVGKVRYQWIGSSTLGENAKVVSIKSMPYKIMDQNGKVLADDVFSMYATNVQGFNLMQIYNSENKAGVLGPDGTWMVKQEWDGVQVLGPTSSYGYDGYGSMGLPVFFSVQKGEKFGALDSKGNWIVPMGYDYIEICQNEIIAQRDGKITLFSFDGKMLVENLDGFGGGYYGYATDCYSYDYTNSGHHVLVKDNKFGIADKTLKVTVPFEYSSLTQIGTTENFVAVNGDGKYGIISSKNDILLPFEYDVIYQFDYYADRLVAGKEGVQGVIDPSGKVLIPFKYYSIASSSDWASNLIYVSDENYRQDIIDTTGKAFISGGCSYLYAYTNYNIFLCSTPDGQYNFYDQGGNKLYSKVATYIDPYSNYDFIQIAQQGDYENPKYGAFDLLSGQDLMAFEYEYLYPFWIGDEVFFAGTIKGKVGIYSATGIELVKPKGTYLDNYYYESGEYGGTPGYYVEISNKKGKSKVIRLEY